MNANFTKILEENKSAFYVFDIPVLKKRVGYLRSRLPSGVSICYAVKANPFVVQQLNDVTDRFEICSPGEANICFKLRIPSEKMVISGIYKTEEVTENMVADPLFNGIFTVESLSQYQLLLQLSRKYGRKLPVLLRLTNDSQFGMNEEDIGNIVSESPETLSILGIQFFSGTQKTSLKRLVREIEYLDSFLISLEENYGYRAEELEYGPGLPVTYFQSDTFDEEEFLGGFSEALKNMNYSCHLTLELGRSISASCGKYYTHIVDMKTNKEQNYIITDGGMNHLVYFGQQMAMKRPYMHVVGKQDSVNVKNWNICGSICSMNDIIVKQTPFPEVEAGDTICFENTGAYCMTEGASLFLSRDIPAIYIQTENDKFTCVRRTFQTELLNTPVYERN